MRNTIAGMMTRKVSHHFWEVQMTNTRTIINLRSREEQEVQPLRGGNAKKSSMADSADNDSERCPKYARHG